MDIMMNYNDEEDEQSQARGVPETEQKLNAMRVEFEQLFCDLNNLIDTSYDNLHCPLICHYCDEAIMNKAQVVNWSERFYHLEKCLTKASREKLTL